MTPVDSGQPDSRGPRILITNAVPLNGGDEALLRATIGLLRDEFPGCSITVLCKDVETCRTYLPDLDLDSDLEYIRYPGSVTGQRLFKARTLINDVVGPSWSARISRALANRAERRIIGRYRSADLVVSSAGGFLHDFYGIEHRLLGFEMAMDLGKPVVILGQSVGPFLKPRSKTRVRDVLGRLDAILLREARSVQHLQECEVNLARVRVTADVAFYWRRLAPHLFAPKAGPVRTIAMSFRQWMHHGVQTEEIVQKGAALCAHLLARHAGTELVFLSTCQGLPEYADDSTVARSVLDRLPDEVRGRCRIDGRRYAPAELIESYSKMDAYIGMRLHGAILSMLGGTPAMAIAYEEKTPGIYASLGLETFQVDHRASVSDWTACADTFIDRIGEIHARLPGVLDAAVDELVGARQALRATLESRRAAPGWQSGRTAGEAAPQTIEGSASLGDKLDHAPLTRGRS
jgi:colanic acid/amylovoran biosynthesis protein